MQMQKVIVLVFATTLSLFSLSGCQDFRFAPVFKINIQQGNLVTADMLDKLEPGMTPGQVHYLMGTPLLVNPITPNRWHYYYRFKPGHHPAREQDITLVFIDGHYDHHEGRLLADKLTDSREDESLEDRVERKHRELD